MFNIFSKVIIIEYKTYVSIYDKYSNVARDKALASYVNSNMTLKSGLKTENVVLSSDDGADYHVTIYSVNRFDTGMLSHQLKAIYDNFKDSFSKSTFSIDTFSAYIFPK